MENNLPEIGENLKCMVCALEKPWGVFDAKTGAAVCKDCRDAAREPDSARMAALLGSFFWLTAAAATVRKNGLVGEAKEILEKCHDDAAKQIAASKDLFKRFGLDLDADIFQ